MSSTETELLRAIVRAVRQLELTLMVLGSVWLFDNHHDFAGWMFTIGTTVSVVFSMFRISP